MAIDLDQPVPSDGSGTNPQVWWKMVTILLAVAIFVQSVFAGASLSGFAWARAAHAGNAIVVVAATFIASLAGVITLRRVPNGSRLAWALIALTVAVFVQFILGKWVAKGDNLLWAHVPLGVMLVGLAGQAVAGARKLGDKAGGI